MDQAEFDKDTPADFQSAEYLLEHGQLDMVLDDQDPSAAVDTIIGLASVLRRLEHTSSMQMIALLFC